MTIVAALALLLSACSPSPPAPTYHAENNPERLSEWGMMRAESGVLTLSEGVAPYDLATPLFSDYALKLRTVWTPDGAPARYDAHEAFDFPVGTVVTKTFYYETEGDAVRADGGRTVTGRTMALPGLRLLETRILVRREAGWEALPYVWNTAQTDAYLKRVGDIIPLTLARADGRREDFAYLVPNAVQCAGCHATDGATRALRPIGLKARHLNKPSTFAGGVNQLDHWRLVGLLAVEADSAPAPANADWTDAAHSLDSRARAYLDVNCSHCHSAKGPARTSGLDLEPATPMGPAFGLCKAPIAAGSGTGGRRYSLVPGAPDESITLFRMETKDPAAMMPELGRAVVHEEAVALIREWIAGMEGGCS